MIKVSICIPAYNNETSVRRLLESIEQQSYQNYEVIVTDDSDGDGVRKLAEEKEYVQYHKNEKRLGATANWNAAIAKSHGEYIKIMHHDDWFTDADSLSAFVALLDENPEAALAFSGSRQVEAERSYERCISKKDADLIQKDYRNLYLGNTIGAPSAVLVRRSALEDRHGQLGIVYDEKLTWLVDMEYYMHILKEHPCFVYTEKPLISIGVGSEQLTERCRDDRELNAFEYGYIYDKYELGTVENNRNRLIKVLADAGKSAEEAAAHGIDTAEYKAEQRRKRISKMKWKLTHLLNGRMLLWVLLVIFILSLVPVLGLAGVNHATGDDLGYGRLTREAWLTTHSQVAVLQAAAETVKQYYYSWQGTWFSIFLFALQPEVFSHKAYVIVPFLMLGIWLGATWLLTRYLLVKKAGFSRNAFGILFVLFAMLGIQFVPSTKSAIFWYNGTAHYVVPYALALLGIYFYLRFTEREKTSRGIGAYIGLAISLLLLGGANYQAALLAPIVMVLFALVQWNDREKRKRAVWCLFPLVLEGAGLLISMKSPGNKVRGGETFGFNIGTVIETILACFVKGVTQSVEYVTTHPLFVLFFAVAAVVIWSMIKERGTQNRYPLPGVFVGLSYCVYCAMFAPEIYAGVEVSGGVYNMNYYMFLFMVFSDMIYLEGALYGWLSGRRAADRISADDTHVRRKVFLGWIALAAACGFLLVFRSDIKQTTAYVSLDYIRSGQAADFKEQMDYQLSVLLDDEVKEVVLPQINDFQGPLMHMPLTDHPEAFTNSVTMQFYGKDSVVAVPAEIWREMQGVE